MPADREERTEAPTPRRRNEARAAGQVARSTDLTAALLLLFGFLALWLFGAPLWGAMLAMLQSSLTLEAPIALSDTLQHSGAIVIEIARRLAPILLVVFVIPVLVLAVQVGILFTLKPLMPRWSKINPLAGLQRLFSMQSMMMALINLGKVLIVGAVAYLSFSAGAAAIVYASTLAYSDVPRLGWHLLFNMSLKLAAALLVIALLDLGWQRYKHERDLRMTKEELRDEYRSMEGDPQIKRRRRQVQLQLAMQRIHRDVPKADVVVTNPTHVAVAIAYDHATMIAPKVICKGADEVALRIRQVAAAHGIPIVERKAVARALYESVDVGSYVPERFYRAIAEILAYVYELSGKNPTQSRRELVGAG